MNEIHIKYPNGLIYKHIKQAGKQLTLRHIFTENGHHLPDYELCFLVNQNTNQLVSKKQDLSSEVPYNIIDAREMLGYFNYLQIEKEELKQNITELQNSRLQFQEKINIVEEEKKQQKEQLENQLKKQEFQILQLNKNIQKIENENKQQQEQFQKQQQDFKTLDSQNQKLKNKYQHYKKLAYNASTIKIDLEKEIIGFQKDIERQKEKVEEQIKQLSEQDAFYKTQLQRETERTKTSEEKYENQWRIQKLSGYTTQEQNSNQINQLNGDKKQLEYKIYKLEGDLQQTKQELEKLQNQNQSLIKQVENYKNEIFEYDKQNKKQETEIKNLKELIAEEDCKILQQGIKIDQFESLTDINYRFRIMRFVELTERVYLDNINFAVEPLFQNKIKQDEKSTDMMFYVYDLFCEKADEMIFQLKSLDIKSTIQKTHKQNFTGKLSEKKFVTKTKQSETNEITDSAQLFFCKKKEKIDMYKKILSPEDCDCVYIVKETFKNSGDDLNQNDRVIDLLCGNIVAGIVLEKFKEELREKKVKFPQQYEFANYKLFSVETHFKKFFFEMLQKSQSDEDSTNNEFCKIVQKEDSKQSQSIQDSKAFKEVIKFLKEVSDEDSNQFYYYIRELQLTKAQKENDKNKEDESQKKKQTQFLSDFIEQCELNQKDKNFKTFQNIFQEFSKQPNLEKYEVFNYLTNFLSDVYIDFPYQKFYVAYEVNLKDINNQEFKKYFNGTQSFEESEEGKFFSALSYYSIIRSHYQFCVSRIQGIGTQLFDPIVSSYDGFLNYLDQGYNEIRNIESSFISSDPDKVGYEMNYLKKQLQNHLKNYSLKSSDMNFERKFEIIQFKLQGLYKLLQKYNIKKVKSLLDFLDLTQDKQFRVDYNNFWKIQHQDFRIDKMQFI